MGATINPATGIVTTDAPDTSLEEKKKTDEAAVFKKKFEEASAALNQKNSQPRNTYITVTKPKRSFVAETQAANRRNPLRTTIFGKAVGVGQPRKSLTIRDKAKLLRFKHSLETQKLKNALQKYKIQKQIENARKQGKLGFAQQVMQTTPVQRLNYPAYSTPMEQADIDHSFKADIGHADGNIFGNEQFHMNDFFMQDDFFLDEFTGDPLLQLGIKIRTGVSPLFW
jgi:hypothetical protein